MSHLVFDVGGTWIKALAIEETDCVLFSREPSAFRRRLRRLRSPASDDSFAEVLLKLARECLEGRNAQSVVVSTAGLIHPSGREISACANHLGFLRQTWLAEIESSLECEVTIINDADAMLFGGCEAGLVPRQGTTCCLVIGTGLGCSIVKDGRLWRPQRSLPLLGSIRIPAGSFDELASASRAAALHADGDLRRFLQDPSLDGARENYLRGLAGITLTAAILYQADHILLGGGLCDAAREAGFPLPEAIRFAWWPTPPELNALPLLSAAEHGNLLQLIGAAAVGAGQSYARTFRVACSYDSVATERSLPEVTALERQPSLEIMNSLWNAEQDAGAAIQSSLVVLAEIADHIVGQWPLGGRIIYVGAGTSGRVAALDAVEIPCTFGCEPERVTAVIAGGLNEACFTIEERGEEDFSAVPDMLPLQPDALDVVIGISASGTAFFVRSALAYAQGRGAATVLISDEPQGTPHPWTWHVPLCSGPEVISGSTRMKAGTATKKLLNFLTTTVMAKLGKIRGPYMIDMLCLNEKLRSRAIRILRELYGLTDQTASNLLHTHAFRLRQAIESYEENPGRQRPTVPQLQ